jgi:hypothetical protein
MRLNEVKEDDARAVGVAKKGCVLVVLEVDEEVSVESVLFENNMFDVEGESEEGATVTNDVRCGVVVFSLVDIKEGAVLAERSVE